MADPSCKPQPTTRTCGPTCTKRETTAGRECEGGDCLIGSVFACPKGAITRYSEGADKKIIGCKVCPAGLTMIDTQAGPRCVRQLEIECPTGYQFDRRTTTVCRRTFNATPVCASGARLLAENSPYVIKAKDVFEVSRNQIVLDENGAPKPTRKLFCGFETSDPECPDGFGFDRDSNTCVGVVDLCKAFGGYYEYDVNTQKCVQAVAPLRTGCAPNPQNGDQCEPGGAPTCPERISLTCAARLAGSGPSAACPDGGAFELKRNPDRCEHAFDIACPVGMEQVFEDGVPKCRMRWPLSAAKCRDGQAFAAVASPNGREAAEIDGVKHWRQGCRKPASEFACKTGPTDTRLDGALQVDAYDAKLVLTRVGGEPALRFRKIGARTIQFTPPLCNAAVMRIESVSNDSPPVISDIECPDGYVLRRDRGRRYCEEIEGVAPTANTTRVHGTAAACGDETVKETLRGLLKEGQTLEAVVPVGGVCKARIAATLCPASGDFKRSADGLDCEREVPCTPDISCQAKPI